MLFSDKYKIFDVKNLSSEVVLLKVNSSLNPLPGQFMEVSVGEKTTPVSSSSYNNYEIDLIFPKNCDFRKELSNLKQGDKITIKGPHGKGYPMDNIKGKNLVLVSEGIGIASIKSVVEFIQQNRLDYKEVYLYAEFNSKDELILQEELSKLESYFHITINLEKLSKKTFLNFNSNDLKSNETVILACGSSYWLRDLAKEFNSKGFANSDIWLNYESKMSCTNGECDQCQINGKYVCMDGPVFCYDEIENSLGTLNVNCKIKK